MPHELSRKDERIVSLAEKGGKNADLYVLDTVEELENRLDEHIAYMDKEMGEMKETMDKMDEKMKNHMTEMKEMMRHKSTPDEETENIVMRLMMKLALVDRGEKGDIGSIGPKGERGEVGEDGLDGRNGIDGKDGRDGKDGSPDTSEQIRDKIHSLTGENRVSIDAIKGVKEQLSAIDQRFNNMPRQVSIFGGRQMRIEPFAFSGDDVTTAFTLPKEPAAKGRSIWAFYQGQWLQRVTHFTVVKRTFTTVGFTAATGTTIEGFIIYQA